MLSKVRVSTSIVCDPLVNGKSKPLILRAIRKGSRRYSELRRAVVGVSDKMLIMHLKELEADHVVTRKDFQEIPPRVEYSLTPFGVSLIDTMYAFTA
ncbi:MAG: winged helix-turn-helix transcriptional regulator [Betaproteobacteria bacterium]